MIRLQVIVNFNEFDKIFQPFLNNPDCLYYEKRDRKSYRHNFIFNTKKEEEKYVNEDVNIITQKNNTFWVGYNHNSERPSVFHNIVIQYNPNKISENDIFFKTIIRKFFTSDKVMVKEFDVAYDIRCNILDLIFDKAEKSNLKTFDYGGDNKTLYIGEGDGRIKIYNKRNEADLDFDCTRIEISKKINKYLYLKYNNVFDDDINLCNIWNIKTIENEQLDLFEKKLTETDRALIYAIRRGFPIDRLPHEKKKKIKELLESSKNIEYSKENIVKFINESLIELKNKLISI